MGSTRCMLGECIATVRIQSGASELVYNLVFSRVRLVDNEMEWHFWTEVALVSRFCKVSHEVGRIQSDSLGY